MVSNLYESLLQEVGSVLGVALSPDAVNSCTIRLKSGVRIQMEIDPAERYFVLSSDLGPVPPGQYRQSLFLAALQANGAPAPRPGTFAFSEAAEHLIVFRQIPLKDLNGERIAYDLKPFAELAHMWERAVTQGELPLVASYGRNVNRSAGMFGMRP